MKWIKVEDSMPEIGKTCLLYITYPKGTMFNCVADPLERTNIEIGGRMYDGRFTSLGHQHRHEELKYVSHWMLLPENP